MLGYLFPQPWTHVLPVLGALLLGPLLLYYIFSTKSPFPLINAQGRFELTATKAKIRFVTDAKNLLKAGYAKVILFWQPSYKRTILG